MKIDIELLYFGECPSCGNALEILNEGLKKLGIAHDVVQIPVETQEEAVRHKFTGSPMIRVNGEDLFPTGQENYALSCRIFQTPDGLKGWPTEEMITEKLKGILADSK